MITLWRKDPEMPCSIMSPVFQNQVLQGCPVYGLWAFYCCCWTMFPFSPVSCSGPLCLLLAGFDLLRHQSGATLGLYLGQTRCPPSAHLLGLWWHQTAECSPCIAPQGFCWWAWPAVRAEVCPLPHLSVGVAVTLTIGLSLCASSGGVFVVGWG